MMFNTANTLMVSNQECVEKNQLSVITPKAGNLYENELVSNNIYKPTASNLSQQVGKQSQLSIFIPKTCHLYYRVLDEKNPYYAKDDKYRHFRSTMDYDVVSPYITHIEKVENGLNVDINIENLSLQEIKISEDYNDENPMSISYYFGYGHVLTAFLSIHIERDYRISLKEELHFNYEKYRSMLVALGYKKEISFKKMMLGKEQRFSYKKDQFESNEIFTKDECVIELKADLRSVYFNLTLSLHDKYVYKNYDAIVKSLKEQRMIEKYNVLNESLK